VLIVFAIFLIGRLQLFPNSIDRNGIGISFAIDSRFYQIEASVMAGYLQKFQFSEWWAFNSQTHVKLYSLAFALFGPVLGFNIISAEPLNLTFYLLILILVYAIGREIFDPGTGLVATGLVAFWPSLLLHTTQMLRDPVFILSFLLLVIALVINLNRRLSVTRGLVVGVTAAVACTVLWLIRGDMWEAIFLIVVIGVVMPVARQLWERRWAKGNTIALFLIFFVSLMIPHVIPTHRQKDSMLVSTKDIQSSKTNPPPPLPQAEFGHAGPTANLGLTKLAQRVGLLRHKFIISYPLAGSNIDTDIELTGLGDVIRYFPRAVEIGLFAPFPNMWFKRGEQVGLQGRLVSGLETFCVYIITVLAIVTMVRNRRNFSVWLLFFIVLSGCTALGYVVVNISTVYRMRYAFWILLIILGANALTKMKTYRRSKTEAVVDRPEVLMAEPEEQQQIKVMRACEVTG
jgi:hypothetical protein